MNNRHLITAILVALAGMVMLIAAIAGFSADDYNDKVGVYDNR